jgi:hypothetical protein
MIMKRQFKFLMTESVNWPNQFAPDAPKKSLWATKLICLASQDDPDDDTSMMADICLLDISNYEEKRGFSLLWFHAPDTKDISVYGRSLLGIYTSYGKIVVDLLFMRILIA